MKYKKIYILLLVLFFLEPVYAQKTEQWESFELIINSKTPKKGFKDVSLTALFGTTAYAWTHTGMA